MEAEANNIKIQIIKRKTIKPSSPTPQNKRVLQLSLIDQTYSSSYGPFIFFYASPTNGPTKRNNHFNLLAKSLSQTLSQFYPFAGRLNDNISIECNDEGAQLLEAEISCELSEFLRKPDPILLQNMLPIPNPKSALLLIQLTAFSCGGTAIGLSVSHKVADGASLGYFIRAWSLVSAGRDDYLSPPEFVGTSLFPPPDSPIQRTLPLPRGRVLVSRRFVFSALKLAELKARRISIPVTSVEAVTALLYKAAANGDRGLSGVIRQHVNLRKRTTPALSENAIGNVLWSFLVFVEGHEMELREIVAKMRETLAEFLRVKADRLRDRKDGVSVVREFIGIEAELDKRGMDMCCFTSLGKFGPYEVNFGQGKPVWVTCPLFNDNMFVLLDTRCGQGIEAWVTLEEQRMAKFEANEELLEFASVNPSAFTYNSRM